MKNIFTSLSKDFEYINNQLNDNLIIGVYRTNVPMPMYKKFSYDINILNKYEDKLGDYFCIKQVFVFDSILKKYIEIEIYIGFGVLLGYSSLNGELKQPVIDKINTNNFYLKFFKNDDYESLKNLINPNILSFINPTEVYMLEIKGNKYYHIYDFEDGDFLSIGMDKKIYTIKHDPFEIIELSGNVVDILKKK